VPNVRITYTEAEDARITAAVRTVETQLPQRRRGAANTPAGGRGAGVTVPEPTAADQLLISKEDPDNPGSFIWEAADPRWGM
jgi:hypothetical protein